MKFNLKYIALVACLTCLFGTSVTLAAKPRSAKRTVINFASDDKSVREEIDPETQHTAETGFAHSSQFSQSDNELLSIDHDALPDTQIQPKTN
jgi:hypothetical protein